MGVSYDKFNKTWRVFYKPNKLSHPIRRSFKDKKLAIKYFKDAVDKYGINHGSRFIDRSGFENRFVKVICRTPQNSSKNKLPQYLCLKKTDHTFCVLNAKVFNNLETAGAPSSYSHNGKGYTTIVRNGKKKYCPILKVNNKYWHFGVFASAEQASSEYKKQRDRYYFCKGENPEQHHKKVMDSWKQESSQRKFMSHHGQSKKAKLRWIVKARDGWQFRIVLNGKKYTKYSIDLSNVVNYRDGFLREHNIPIPDDRKDEQN